MSQISQAERAAIAENVSRAVAEVKITDIHTHIYPPPFGDLLLWGIDELLTYHYLVAETTRWVSLPYEKFWAMSKREQADLIWQTLFIEHSPYSEACRGVLTVLEKMGMDVSSRKLDNYRAFCAKWKVEDYVDKVFELAGVEQVVMTNDPFDDLERPIWLSGYKRDPRFKAALRIDGLLNNWQAAVPALRNWGYEVEPGDPDVSGFRSDENDRLPQTSNPETSVSLSAKTISEVQRFLRDWIRRMEALYMAVSLPPNFAFPDNSPRGTLIEKCVLPVARETGIPFAMMIGVKKLVNPALKLAGDSVGKGNIEVVEYLCANYPDNKFLVTMLSRENQHELAVAARKFRNLMVFGCWWFLNNPSIIEEMTRMRFELLGPSVIPQHSDARVLDQLVYKWAHSRKIIGDVLTDKYLGLAATGWKLSEAEIRRDVADLFGGNFRSFLAR